MLINADFASSASLTPNQYQWVNSPQTGVERVMLDRIGGEIARATSIVRYAAESAFPRHLHAGGEEILVLSGTFSDEGGHYPEGWYLRNPPGSSHQPFSTEGVTIFVKLGQMNLGEQSHVRIDTGNAASWQRIGKREVCPLFSDIHEQVSLQRLSAGEVIFQDGLNGFEVLVLSGAARMGDQLYPQGSWLRLPAETTTAVYAGPSGITCYLKSGHLAEFVSSILK